MEKTMQRLPNTHTGEVLHEEFLVPLGISQYRLAKTIGVSQPRIGEICAGKRGITADTALRLARAFGNSPGFWLALQANYDLETAMGAKWAGHRPHSRAGVARGRVKRLPALWMSDYAADFANRIAL
jgi:addiction module HigA family antidote